MNFDPDRPGKLASLDIIPVVVEDQGHRPKFTLRGGGNTCTATARMDDCGTVKAENKQYRKQTRIYNWKQIGNSSCGIFRGGVKMLLKWSVRPRVAVV